MNCTGSREPFNSFMSESALRSESCPESLEAIANQFATQGSVAQVKPFGSGNINDTFLVLLNGAPDPYFILQRINTQIFQYPQGVMQNMRVFTEHVRDRLAYTPLSDNRRWEVPQVLLTRQHQDHYQDTHQSFWRALSFIDQSHTLDTIQDTHHAQEIGYGLGMFHNLISDLPASRLVDTLPGFHITPIYLAQFDRVLAQSQVEQSQVKQTAEVKSCLKFVEKRRAIAPLLEIAKEAGALPLRLMHGDPKINNVMLDKTTGQAVSMIDLDTVKPGLVHYDIGDCLRSGCNPLGEETDALDAVRFELDLAEAILRGYLSVAQNFLTPGDYDYLFDSIRLITFELGLRFLTDYLAGNRYFKVKYPEHNLARAMVQFQLVQSIEAQAQTLQRLIQSLQPVLV